LVITATQAKQLHLHHLGLWGHPSEQSALEVIDQIGHLQLDTISVVARTQDLVLHSRSTSYTEEDVWKELEHGKLFEEFAHARSLIQMEKFPEYYWKMVHRRKDDPWWFSEIKQPEKLIEQALNLLDEFGEITTSDIEIENAPKWRWGSASKYVVDYLTTRGYAMVSRRENYTSVYYKRTEDIVDEIPDDTELPDRLEVFWNDLERDLLQLGLTPLDRLLKYTHNNRRFEYQGKQLTPRYLIKDGLDKGRLCQVEVQDYPKPMYHHPDVDPHDIDLPNVENPSVYLLSPFDNLLWSRKSLLQQYQFDYKFEAYTPKKKRIYGFYSLPILYGMDLVGRVDPKVDRSSAHLSFKHWHFEENFSPSTHFYDALSCTIERFIVFHKASSYDFGDLENSHQHELENRITI